MCVYCMRVYIHVYVYTYIYIYISVCVCIYIYICVCVYYKYIIIYIYIYICMCVCVRRGCVLDLGTEKGFKGTWISMSKEASCVFACQLADHKPTHGGRFYLQALLKVSARICMAPKTEASTSRTHRALGVEATRPSSIFNSAASSGRSRVGAWACGGPRFEVQDSVSQGFMRGFMAGLGKPGAQMMPCLSGSRALFLTDRRKPRSRDETHRLQPPQPNI